MLKIIEIVEDLAPFAGVAYGSGRTTYFEESKDCGFRGACIKRAASRATDGL